MMGISRWDVNRLVIFCGQDSEMSIFGDKFLLRHNVWHLVPTLLSSFLFLFSQINMLASSFSPFFCWGNFIALRACIAENALVVEMHDNSCKHGISFLMMLFQPFLKGTWELIIWVFLYVRTFVNGPCLS